MLVKEIIAFSIVGIIGIISIIVLLYTLFISVPKNNNTYKIRIKMIDEHHSLYHYLPSYEKMNRLWYKKKYWTIDYWLDYARLQRYKS